ncbi:MAG TPA: TIGR03546 family protein [Pseudobdellovibrionaceae bacterium]|nr:TIGR03546 family protein [Pseudobdellovibrionaceae bacterium]
MTFLLKQIFGFLKLLNSDKGTNQIAAGIACGLILGFAPAFSLQTLLVIAVLFFFRIQIGAATVFAFFFSFIAWILDPLHHAIGQAVLENESLTPLFTEMYNMPLVPLTRFNNSIVMGSGLVAIALSPIVFIGSRVAIAKYRETVVARFQQTKFWKAVQATSLYKFYATYEQLYG